MECVTKTTVEPARCQIRAARCSAARASSRRARRTARPSAAAPARTRARARSRRAAACRPRAATGGGRRSRCSSTSSSISSTRCLRARAVPAEHLERQRDVLRDGAPVEEHGVLEDDPVVAVDRACGARLAVDRTVPADGSTRSPITRSSVDLPQPDGPISETNSPASTWRSMSCSAVTFPCGNVFVTRRSRRRRARSRACSGARWTTSFSTITTTRKKTIPSAAATMFVAQSFSGWIE